MGFMGLVGCVDSVLQVVELVDLVVGVVGFPSHHLDFVIEIFEVSLDMLSRGLDIVEVTYIELCIIWILLRNIIINMEQIEIRFE